MDLFCFPNDRLNLHTSRNLLPVILLDAARGLKYENFRLSPLHIFERRFIFRVSLYRGVILRTFLGKSHFAHRGRNRRDVKPITFEPWPY